MLKFLRRILEMRGSAGSYVTASGTTSLESLGLVCNALVREILAGRRNCSSNLKKAGMASRNIVMKKQYTLF